MADLKIQVVQSVPCIKQTSFIFILNKSCCLKRFRSELELVAGSFLLEFLICELLSQL